MHLRLPLERHDRPVSKSHSPLEHEAFVPLMAATTEEDRANPRGRPRGSRPLSRVWPGPHAYRLPLNANKTTIAVISEPASIRNSSR